MNQNIIKIREDYTNKSMKQKKYIKKLKKDYVLPNKNSTREKC